MKQELELPELTRSLMAKIHEDAQKGTYIVEIEGILIDVFPYVFPPISPFSKSTYSIYSQFRDLKGKNVLDVGTGTGILAIASARSGAGNVDAIDISEEAVKCAKHNVKLNQLDDKVKVWQSNLFSAVPKENKYDLIIANLPILDYPEQDLRFHSLSDPSFEYHKRLFEEAVDFLNLRGVLQISHTNLQKDGFEKLETLAEEKGFKFQITQEIEHQGYKWRNYEFRLK